MRRSELIMAVYVPTALLAVGQGVLLATLPSYATSLGVGLTAVSVISAAAAMGTLVADVPAGALLHKMGLRNAMLVGAVLVVIGTMTLALPLDARTVVALRVLAGVGTAMWGLSRHAFIAQAIQPSERGRSISIFGGINRAGMFAGPAIGGYIATWFGLQAPFLVAGMMGVIAFIAGILFIPRDQQQPAAKRASSHSRWALVGQSIKLHSADFAAASVAQFFGQLVRQGRLLLIPLMGVAIGLSLSQIGLVLAVSSLVDMSMFYPAGVIMDRFGRKYSAVPSFAILAVGVGMLAFATSYWSLMAIGVLIGLGNGLGSGSMMTLGADLSPPGATGEFLGVWRLIGDIGNVTGPLLVGLIGEHLSLNTSAIALMMAGLFAAGIFFTLVRETRYTADNLDTITTTKIAMKPNEQSTTLPH
ncbi:MAG: MFS transporter [Thermomicrobiales bacterium]